MNLPKIKPDNKKGIRAVKSLVMKNNRILLLYSKDYRQWTLPGGKLEEDEDMFNALKRELREELGVDGKPIRLVCTAKTRNLDGKEVESEVWLTEIVGTPKLMEPDEHEKIEWFALSKVPPDLSELAKIALSQFKP